MKKIKHLINKVKGAEPKLKGLSDEDAHLLLQQALKCIVEEIEATPEGSVRIPALGAFTIRKVEREREGRKMPVRRIQFRPATKNRA
jgi:hypothetical protein